MDLIGLAKENRRRVLQYLLRTGGAPRGDIARNTGLSPALLTDITGRLLDQGVLRVKESVSDGKRGRPATILEMDPDKALVVVAYLERGQVTAQLVGPDGMVRDTVRTVVPRKKSFDMHLAELKEAVRVLCRTRWDQVRALSLVTSGIVDTRQGVLLGSIRHGWRKEPMFDAFRSYRKPLFLQNPYRLRAISENWYGAAQDLDDFLYFHLGQSIGGAVVLNGELLEGPSHGAGEFGHVHTPYPEICPCGRNGCLEAVASGVAIVRSIFGDKPGDFQDAWELFEKKDGRAVEVFKTVAKAIASVIEGMAIVIGPTIVLVGGMLVEQTQGKILPLISRELSSASQRIFFGPIELRPCALADDVATMRGAAISALWELDLQ